MWYYLSIYNFFNLFTLNQCKDMKIPPFFQKKSTIKFRFIVKMYLTLGIRGIKKGGHHIIMVTALNYIDCISFY